MRAGMVQHPGEYCWSSYRRNGLQLKDALVEPHPEYQDLGSDGNERCEQESVLAYTQPGTPLGGGQFGGQIETLLSMKAGQPKRGRPRGPFKGSDPLN